MKKITLFLLAVCTTALIACGGGGSFKAVIELYEKATKDIASIESLEALEALEVDIHSKAHELSADIAAKGGEPTDAEMEQMPVVTAKYTAAIQAKAQELMAANAEQEEEVEEEE